MKSEICMTEEFFGPFWPYVEKKEITDIDFNGTQLWVRDLQGNRWEVKDHGVTPQFIEQFTHRIANKVSKPFNRVYNLLEAETKTLRISIVHESAAVSGRSICIRKAPPYLRMNAKDALRQKYCSREMLMLLANCVKARMNLVFCGEPGVGKTECAKFFSQFIPAEDRVITIEDSLEWHYKEINPGKDCVELQVKEGFEYQKAIKTSLRQNPKWIMLSEARSTEVKALMECWSTGVRGFTTLHTDDVRKIPDRILNMMESRTDAERMENDVYTYVDVGILLRMKADADGRQYRYIDQICFYTRQNFQNEITMIASDGELVEKNLPPEVERKLSRAGIGDAFYQEEIACQLQLKTGENYERAL
ncbi:MAG: ATPase, T2SS/T4P/T4SS family [Lachnospiraceae bacterium]